MPRLNRGKSFKTDENLIFGSIGCLGKGTESILALSVYLKYWKQKTPFPVQSECSKRATLQGFSQRFIKNEGDPFPK